MGNHTEIQPNDVRSDMGLHPVDVKPPSPMGQALSTLEDEIDRLFGAIENLAGRVAPVLGPDLGDAPTESKNPMMENSEIVRYIVDQAGRVRNARITLVDISQRVEL